MRKLLLSLSGLAALVVAWDLAVRFGPPTLLPLPAAAGRAILELAANGLLLRHLVASLYRVTWGYLLAVLLALPVGLFLGVYPAGERAFGPFLELLRPISPLAWIPLAIFWLGIGDLAAVAIIFLASFLPLALTVKNGVRRVPAVHLQVGRNFGLG